MPLDRVDEEMVMQKGNEVQFIAREACSFYYWYTHIYYYVVELGGILLPLLLADLQPSINYWSWGHGFVNY